MYEEKLMSKVGELDGDEIMGCHIFGTRNWPKHLEIVTRDREIIRLPMCVLLEMIKRYSFQWEKSIEHRYVKDFRLRS